MRCPPRDLRNGQPALAQRKAPPKLPGPMLAGGRTPLATAPAADRAASPPRCSSAQKKVSWAVRLLGCVSFEARATGSRLGQSG